MYFTNIKNLKEELITHPIEDSEVIKYFIIFILAGLGINILPVEFIKIVGSTPIQKQLLTNLYIERTIYFFIYSAGIYYCYRMNKGPEGNQFLQRYISIGFVINIRFLLIILVLSIFIFIGLWLSIYFSLFGLTNNPNLSSQISSSHGSIYANVWQIIPKAIQKMGIVMEILILWRIGSHIKAVAQMAKYRTKQEYKIENQEA